MRFEYAPEIAAQYPRICGGVLAATALRGGPSQTALLDEYRAEQAATIARIGDTPLSELPSLAAWRQAFRTFGVNPTKTRSATEALLRRLTKQGDIPSINRLVDIGNLVSIRYALPVAVFDTRAVVGAVRVHESDGTERFRELGSDEVLHPVPGEVIFSDHEKMVIARRWCWRQSAESAAREDTTRALVTVEAQHEHGRADIEAAVADLTALLQRYAGATITSAVLDADTPTFLG